MVDAFGRVGKNRMRFPCVVEMRWYVTALIHYDLKNYHKVIVYNYTNSHVCFQECTNMVLFLAKQLDY